MNHRNLEIPYLRTHELFPENQETPIHFLREWITPENYFFVRNHFSYPDMNEFSHSIEVGGLVGSPTVFPFDTLIQMPTKSLLIPLECSGNKRSFFNPKVYGTQWEEGAISQGIWTGVPLYALLQRTGIHPQATQVVFEGADSGQRTDMPGQYSYQRSLPLNIALHPDTMIAFQLNGKAIPYQHGYPLRLVVPGWYGMAWVKWLKKITLIQGKFSGPFQAIDYQYYPHKHSDRGKHPVTWKNVNSTILSPLHMTNLKQSAYKVEGIAWTGKGKILEVQVSSDHGISWKNAVITQVPKQSYAWIYWNYTWTPVRKGEYTLLSRARDSAGRIQPIKPYWNRKGYGYNAASEVKVQVD